MQWQPTANVSATDAPRDRLQGFPSAGSGRFLAGPGGAASGTPPPAGQSETGEELALVAALRRGDEDAFVALLDRYHGALLRLARVWIRDAAGAEDVVQETWLAVLQGIDRFEGRSSLKTWLFGILANQAKRRVRREIRSVPFATLGDASDGDHGPAVDPDRFFPADHPWAGHWSRPPIGRGGSPEAHLLAAEVGEVLRQALAELPSRYRAVIVLRDVEGRTSAETCNILGISATNQRVLLHRARSRIRQALEPYLDAEGTGSGGDHTDNVNVPGAR